MNKKELAVVNRTLAKLRRSLGGLKNMRGEPGLVVVVDVKHELNAVQEARKAGVPIVSLVDTNADPTLSDYNIPGNDDALKSIRLIVGRLADAIAAGNAERENALAVAKEASKAPAKEVPQASVAEEVPVATEEVAEEANA
jgi:small subunit ribosomal protein S2